MLKKTLLLLILLMAVLLSACNGAATPPAADGEQVVGAVNGENVYQYEYDFYFNMYYNEYFSNYYETLLYYQNVDMLDEESAHDLLANLEQYSWDSVVQSALIRQMAANDYNITLEPSYMDELLLPAYANAIRTNRLYSDIYPRIQEEAQSAKAVSEDEARATYEADPVAWDSRQVAHIIFTAEAGNEAAKEQARAQAQDIIDQLDAGADFAELAREHSQDGAAANGGAMDLYFNARGGGISDSSSFDPAFAAAAFEIGQVGGYSSQPVESSFGYHVIKVLDQKIGFEAAKDFIISSLQTVSDDEVSGFFQQKLEQKQGEADIECNVTFKYYSEEASEPAEVDSEEPAEEPAS